LYMLINSSILKEDMGFGSSCAISELLESICSASELEEDSTASLDTIISADDSAASLDDIIALDEEPCNSELDGLSSRLVGSSKVPVLLEQAFQRIPIKNRTKILLATGVMSQV